MRRLTNQSGDTIVEVLLSIAIVSLILGAAYVSANQSIKNVRRSQERIEATKVAEGQAEMLKAAIVSDNAISGLTTSFCLRYAGGASPISRTNFPAAFSTVPANSTSDALVNYPDYCKQDPNGGVIYHLSITKDPTLDAYNIRARWAKYGGTGIEEVNIRYKVYQ